MNIAAQITTGAPVDRLEDDGSYTRVTTRYATDVIDGKTTIAFSVSEQPNFDLAGWIAEQEKTKAILSDQIALIDAAILAAGEVAP